MDPVVVLLINTFLDGTIRMIQFASTLPSTEEEAKVKLEEIKLKLDETVAQVKAYQPLDPDNPGV